MTIANQDGFRGVTVSGLLPVALDPPSIAFVLQRDSQFHHLLEAGSRVGISILDRQQEFMAERFAGRAPVPDSSFSGVPHRLVEGIPLIDGAIGFSLVEVSAIQVEGDHVLVVAAATWFELPPDTDEPMVLYETRYRGLDIS
jgi:flavin reductase (DIM6/NTAB) family NADH-FMN oxidoreductase RutF